MMHLLFIYSIILALLSFSNLRMFFLKSLYFGLKYVFLDVLVEVINFCLPEKIFVSLPFLKDSFFQYIILGTVFAFEQCCG